MQTLGLSALPTSFHSTPPGSSSLLQLSINSEEVHGRQPNFDLTPRLARTQQRLEPHGSLNTGLPPTLNGQRRGSARGTAPSSTSPRLLRDARHDRRSETRRQLD